MNAFTDAPEFTLVFVVGVIAVVGVTLYRVVRKAVRRS